MIGFIFTYSDIPAMIGVQAVRESAGGNNAILQITRKDNLKDVTIIH